MYPSPHTCAHILASSLASMKKKKFVAPGSLLWDVLPPPPPFWNLLSPFYYTLYYTLTTYLFLAAFFGMCILLLSPCYYTLYYALTTYLFLAAFFGTCFLCSFLELALSLLPPNTLRRSPKRWYGKIKWTKILILLHTSLHADFTKNFTAYLPDRLSLISHFTTPVTTHWLHYTLAHPDLLTTLLRLLH